MFFYCRLKFNLLEYYVRRFFRLYPVAIISNLIYHAYLPYVKSPFRVVFPTEGFESFDDFLVKINQFHWYVKADIMLYFISPLILFPLFWYGYRMFPILILLLLKSVPLTYFAESDYCFLARYPAWLLGLMLGYMMQQDNKIQWKITKPQVILVWPALLLCLIEINGIFNIWSYIFRKLISPFVVFWLAYLLLENQFPRVVKFLSSSILQFFCKLSYSVYMLMTPVLDYIRLDMRPFQSLSTFLMLQSALAAVTTLTIFAIPWTLLFECPYANFQKEIFNVKFSVPCLKAIPKHLNLFKCVWVYFKKKSTKKQAYKEIRSAFV